MLGNHLESVVWEVSDSQRLHVGRGIRQQEHHQSGGSILHSSAILCCGMSCSPEHHIGECMIEAEVGVCHEVQRYWYLKSHITLISIS